MLLDITKPFILYAQCNNIEYYGRAESELPAGDYLILYKLDKSLLIHGGDKIPPRNYQGTDSKLCYENGVLIVKRKSEQIKINILSIKNLYYPDNWSLANTAMRKTEKDLSDKIKLNWDALINIRVDQIINEYKTPYGPVDLCGMVGDRLYFVEVKRKTATVKDVTQLKRYVDHTYCVEVGFLASPKISASALDLLESYSNLRWLEIDF